MIVRMLFLGTSATSAQRGTREAEPSDLTEELSASTPLGKWKEIITLNHTDISAWAIPPSMACIDRGEKAC